MKRKAKQKGFKQKKKKTKNQYHIKQQKIFAS